MKFFRFIIFILQLNLFFPVSGHTQAKKKPPTYDYCSSVDLRPQMGPIANQDGTGWCYAYAAADIVSFKLKKKISPIDIALQNHKYEDGRNQTAINKATLRGSQLGSGGYPDLSILTAQLEAKGFCPDEKISTNDLKENQLNDTLVNFNSVVRDLRYKSKFDKYDCADLEEARKIFPGLSLNEVEDVARAEGSINAASALASKACAPRIMAQNYLLPKSIRNVDKKLNISLPLKSSQFSQINRHLSPPKPSPAALTIRMEKFYDFGGDNSTHAIHAMTLVGRKRNPKTGKCEYIVRNSWGPECSAFYKPNVRCENGELFISEEELKKATIAADILEK